MPDVAIAQRKMMKPITVLDLAFADLLPFLVICMFVSLYL